MPGDVEATIKRLLTIHFASPQDTLRIVLVNLASIEQSCDVTFRNRNPLIDVKVDKRLAAAADDPVGRSGIGKWFKGIQLSRLFGDIHFSDGSRASLNEIWTVNPVPVDGIPEGALADVDLSTGDDPIDSSGVTSRDLVRATYRCANRAQEDEMLRRYLVIG